MGAGVGSGTISLRRGVAQLTEQRPNPQYAGEIPAPAPSLEPQLRVVVNLDAAQRVPVAINNLDGLERPYLKTRSREVGKGYDNGVKQQANDGKSFPVHLMASLAFFSALRVA